MAKEKTRMQAFSGVSSGDNGNIVHVRSRNVMPIDTGFAWVVCASTFFITFLMATYDHTLAVVLPDLIEKYEATVATTTLVFTINNLCFGIGSVLASSVAVPRTNERVVIVASAILNAVVTVILAFSPNIIFFHLMHVIKGICLGSMWVPALGLVEHYFVRHRSFATALCSCGIACSMLVSTQMIRLLTDYYGLSGAYLVLGALEMHGVAAALLLRPVTAYRGVISNSDEALTSRRATLVESPEEEVLFISRSTSMATSQSVSSIGRAGMMECTAQTPSDVSVINKKVGSCNTSETYCRPSDTSTGMGGSEHLANSSTLEDTDGGKYERLQMTRPLPLGDGDEDAICNMKLVEIGAAADNEGKPLESNRKVISEDKKDNVRSGKYRCGRSFCGLLDTNLLSNWMFHLILLSTVHGALMMYTLAYIPTLALSQGLDKKSGTLLLTIAGAVNFVGMPLQGIVLDTNRISPSQYVALAQIVVGTACHLIRYLTSFPALVVISVTQGLLGGSRISLIPVMAVEFVDVQSAGKIVGFNALVGTISLAAHHPFLGNITDLSGSFNISFHYVGFGLYVSSLLLFLSPVVRKKQGARRRQMEVTTG